MLRSFPRSLLVLSVAPSLLIFLATICVMAQEPAPGPTANPTPPALTADQKKKIADVQAAVKDVNSTVTGAAERRKTASALVDRIKRLVSSKKGDEAALRDLEDLQDVVATVEATKFYIKNNPDTDHIVLKDLSTVEKKLKDAKTALPSGESQPEEIVAAHTSADEALTRLSDERTIVTRTREDLRTSIASIYSFALSFPEVLKTRLKTLGDLPATEKGPRLRNVLSRQLPVFRSVELISRELNGVWPDLNTELKALGLGSDATVADINTKLADLRAALKAIRVKLLINIKDDPATTSQVENDAWLLRLAEEGFSEATKINSSRDLVRRDPVANSTVASHLLRENSPLVDDLRTVQREWVATEAQLLETDDLEFDRTFADEAADRVERSVRAVRAALADLQDALAGDMSNFEADQISLFYFTDIPRLMQMLNAGSFEVGGIRTASEEAASKRRELTNTELDLADAQSAVNAAQQRVVVLREELAQANRAASGASGIFKRTTQALTRAQRDKESNDRRFNEGQCEPLPTDPAKRANCENLASERDRAAQRVEEAEKRNKAADDDHKLANERSAALRDEQNGLPSRIAEAESKLENAQAAVNRQRRSALLAAQAESEAFAKARDNRPFWVAPVNGTSTDPVKRVFLWAFNDSKTVFMRGPRADMDIVKCLIAKIDQPAPQARMTLWTLELSSDSSVGGAKKTNRSLEIIDSRLSNSRVLNAATLSLFRDAINQRVNQAAAEALRVANDACTTAACRSEKWLDGTDAERLARLSFYQEEVLKRLGLNPKKLFDKTATDPLLARLLVPDPAGTTTLGEALMVLSLGRQDYRNDVMTLFLIGLATQLPQLGLTNLPKDLSKLMDKKNGPAITWFPNLRRAIDLDGFPHAHASGATFTSDQLEIVRNLIPGSPSFKAGVMRDMSRAKTRDQQVAIARLAGLTASQVAAVTPPVRSGFTSAQLEILHAMEQVGQDRLLAYTRTLLTRYIERGKEISSKKTAAGMPVTTPVCPGDNLAAGRSLQDRLDEEARARAQLTPEELEAARKALEAAQKERAETEKKINEEIARELQAKGQTATPEAIRAVRESRELEVKALEGEYCKLQRDLRRLFGKIEGLGITWDRVKQLADAQMSTNPVVATNGEMAFKHLLWEKTCAVGLRVANAREAAADQMLKEMIIAVEDDLDRLFIQPMLRGLREDLQRQGIGVGIVQRTSVLATNRLLARVEPRASAQLPLGQTTDVLQAAQQLSEIFFAAQAGGPLGALGALQSLPRTPQAELYGLTTGNVFQVTPVFDPSGQALRFRFDYVNASMIQEPNGTINPQLPRIERHTVNTEVQLSNLELREISRYESNARLGIATRYAGGLPILKDIPYVRYIPLIGWFVRTSGKAAVTQQSLIFGQTTMYPTIADIMGLLTTDATVDISKEPTP